VKGAVRSEAERAGRMAALVPFYICPIVQLVGFDGFCRSLQTSVSKQLGGWLAEVFTDHLDADIAGRPFFSIELYSTKPF
jgi:hypothetical protein